MGPEARRGGILGGHTRVSDSVDDGEAEAWWDCRTQHVGRRKARTWVGNTWRNWAKGKGHLLEKSDGGRAEKKSVRKKHKATRTRSRLEELTFGTFNVRTAAVNGVNGIGHIDTLLRTCAAKGCDVIGLQETKRDGTSEISASGYRTLFSGDCSGVKVAVNTTVPRSPFFSF